MSHVTGAGVVSKASIKAVTDPKNWIRNAVGSDPGPDPDPLTFKFYLVDGIF